MQSKYATAREVAAAGIHVYIANGKSDNILFDLMKDPTKVAFTHFNIR